MNYQQWGTEYLNQAERLKARIQTLRIKLPEAPKPQRDDLLYRIRLLYAIYLELRHTGIELRKRGKIG